MLSELIAEQNGLPFPASITTPEGGGKFSVDGTPLLFPGNTFICHVAPASAFHRALCAMQDRLQGLPWANHFTFLPKSSLHMTTFCGVCGSPLGEDGWPAGVGRNATLGQISAGFLYLFKNMQCPPKFRMRPAGIGGPARVSMMPATGEDARSLREMRHRLQELTGIYRTDIDSYQFHISLSYIVRWLSRDDAISYSRAAAAIFEECLGDIKTVDIGPVEFCEFETMHHFRPICPGQSD